MQNKTVLFVAALFVVMGLSGCWESTDVTVHEPGQYKGVSDPLLQQSAASRAETLQQRFEMVQVDR
ncbi:MAG: hypothetical protein OEU36_20675 [Gammaproteobacteria bacterium]|nr:hypothetical protein [Gammaproteobacteria bacterium]